MPELLTPDHFFPHLNKVFKAQGGRHALTLTEVSAAILTEEDRAAALRCPFTLIFAGPPGDLLDEGLYTFDVDDDVTFELYVMPIHTSARSRQDYQAAFN
jgi:hypothetical protein